MIALLQLAHSGELAAAHAYTGHADSLRRGHPDQAAEIDAIKDQELDHRHRVRAMLDALGVVPDGRRERRLDRLGRLIGAFCHVGGWFGPMYGAARLERKNIGEYERAARFAIGCGCDEFVEDLIDMAEVEWDHERYFREHSESHWLWRVFPRWDPPPAREQIRAGVAAPRPAVRGDRGTTRDG
ncbi:MAG: ferritin-like domain-containing protein [Desertimonas sp.]